MLDNYATYELHLAAKAFVPPLPWETMKVITTKPDFNPPKTLILGFSFAVTILLIAYEYIVHPHSSPKLSSTTTVVALPRSILGNG
jgi:hypothetical protein